MKHDNTEIISEEIAERFKYALEYLKKNFGETQNSIANRMKIASSNLSRIANRKIPLTWPMAITFEHVTDVSAEWVFYGKADMFVDKKRSGNFTDDEIRFFTKIKKNAELFKIVKALSLTKSDKYELILSLVLKLNK
ncbi:hypothetical protein [Leptospira alstonii]|uniref:hypothetical protein n=1 Tax=Leptospira alstonii TaxID=28452 RepID=UPI00055E5272|nr:hypothetical protein [Leptospira alstonii]